MHYLLLLFCSNSSMMCTSQSVRDPKRALVKNWSRVLRLSVFDLVLDNQPLEKSLIPLSLFNMVCNSRRLHGAFQMDVVVEWMDGWMATTNVFTIGMSETAMTNEHSHQPSHMQWTTHFNTSFRTKVLKRSTCSTRSDMCNNWAVFRVNSYCNVSHSTFHRKFSHHTAPHLTSPHLNYVPISFVSLFPISSIFTHSFLPLLG